MSTHFVDSEDFVSLDRILDLVANALDYPPYWPQEWNRELTEVVGEEMTSVITPPGILKRPILITEATQLLLAAINRNFGSDKSTRLVWKKQMLADRYVHHDENGEIRREAISLLRMAAEWQSDATHMFFRYSDPPHGQTFEVCDLPRSSPWERIAEQSEANLIGLDAGELYRFLEEHRIPYQVVSGPMPAPLVKEEIGTLFNGRKTRNAPIKAMQPQTWDIPKWKDVLSRANQAAWLRPALVVSDKPKQGSRGGSSALFNPVRLARQLYQAKNVPLAYLDNVFEKPELAGWLPFWEHERKKIARIERDKVVVSQSTPPRKQRQSHQSRNDVFGNETNDEFDDQPGSKSGGNPGKITGVDWRAPKTPRKP
ncbi:hypothetical protein [Paraburkholderia sp. J12]|uniref:hypothetical protein n=1 Tax=Paraburkholderia sp. J12 TaxID=2805432 RepID=UPI002ABD5F20|nr:hypothetical protein [Paraburkholderia sp. J12]